MTHDKTESETKLDEIARSIDGCSACHLRKTRCMSVPGEGSPTPSFIIVGEAPGKEEDACGRPFVGRCGILLRETLRTIDVSPEDIFICNTVKCRPSCPESPKKDRTPTVEEMRSCAGFLREQLLCLTSDDGHGFPVRRLPIVALGKSALKWFAEFLWTKEEYEEKFTNEDFDDYPNTNTVRNNIFPKEESRWTSFRLKSVVENSIAEKPFVFAATGNDGDMVRFPVYTLWHPSYVLRGGVTRKMFAESMRGVIKAMG